MSGSSRKLSALLVILLSFTTTSQAQFAEDALRFSQLGLGVGARSLGMGNAAVGLADDYSALFWNPAGLGSIRDFEFSVGLSTLAYSNDVTFFGATTKANNNTTNLNNLGIVYPVPTRRGSLTFAFGYGRVANYATQASYNGFNPSSSIVEALTPNVNVSSMPADERKALLDNNIPFQIFLSDTSNGRLFPLVTDSVQQSGTVSEGGGVNNWSLGGAIDIAKDLSLGVAVNLVSGSYSYDRVYTERDAKNIYHYAPPYDFDRFQYENLINSDLNGYNVLIGLTYRKQGRYRLGATVRTPTYFEISETFTDIGTSWFDNGDNYEKRSSNSTKYNVKTPVVLSAGASVQMRDWLVLAGDVEYTDWTQMEFTNDNPDLIEENRTIKQIFQATTNLRGGVEFTIWDWGTRLRFGVVQNPSPYKGDQKDFDQIYYTAGAGIDLDKNVQINGAFVIGKWKTFRDNYYVGGFSAPPSRTSESVNSSSLNVTLSYRF